MKLQSLTILAAFVPYALGYPQLAHFPEYRSLAGLSPEQVRAVARTFDSTPGAQPLPPPINDTSAKLVYDAAHPFVPDQPGDIRGPCPGLNTLASHGYLPHNGVATPAQIITAVQEGFNMAYDVAVFLTYAAFVVDGNHLTNLMSIGANTTADYELTPGLNIHGNFEGNLSDKGRSPVVPIQADDSIPGDASTTREDFYFGNNWSFNETLFDQLVDAANLIGDGYITVDSAIYQKAQRINNSIATNPTFWFESPRYLTAYAEVTFPLAFFVSNQTANMTLNLAVGDARSFFEDHKYPDGFWRRQAPYLPTDFYTLYSQAAEAIHVYPGYNDGINNYVVDPEDPATLCYAYQKQANLTGELYPDPTPELEAAIKANLITFYETLGEPTCEQMFPFGQ